MKSTRRLLSFALLALAASVAASNSLSNASDIVPTNFNGYGTAVNGFQDFFSFTTFNPGWSELISGSGPATAGSSGNFTLPGDGTLHINGGNGDPNKLLYTGATYDSSNQNVLAMIEVTGETVATAFGQA